MTLLAEAQKVVQDRQEVYGNPHEYFQRFSELVNVWLGGRYCLTSQDMAMIMLLGKVARLIESPDHHDSILDIAGYADCYAEVVKWAKAGTDGGQ